MRLLVMEGNPRERRDRSAALGLRTSSGIYAEALAALFPDLGVDVVHAADADGAIPGGNALASYHGFVISGSALHAYDDTPEVRRQIALVRAAADAGVPILGSCWGLQIAAVAGGGEVRYNAHGREVGIARKIVANEAGRAHPLLAERAAAFDAPCIHYDEVTRLPAGATLLASNAHSKVQAAVIPLGRSEVWAVQYHPEFDLRHLAQLYGLYADDMIAQGFFADQAALDDYAGKLEALDADPGDAGLAWQLGVDGDVLDPHRRRSEIATWVRAKVLGR